MLVDQILQLGDWMFLAEMQPLGVNVKSFLYTEAHSAQLFLIKGPD